MILSHLSPVIALVLYLLGAAFSSSSSERQILILRVVIGLAIVFHLHSLYFFLPILSLHLLAFSTSAVALVLGLCFIILGGGKFAALRQFVLGFIVVLYLASSVLLHLGHTQSSELKSVYLLWSHVLFSLVGLLSFLASGGLGLAYLTQARALRPSQGVKIQERLAMVLGRLPPLRELSRLIKLTGKVGLFSTVIGLYLGFLYTESSGVRFAVLDPKLLLPIILVIYYGFVLIFRSKISEKLFAKLSSFGIFLTITSLVVSSIK